MQKHMHAPCKNTDRTVLSQSVMTQWVNKGSLVGLERVTDKTKPGQIFELAGLTATQLNSYHLGSAILNFFKIVYFIKYLRKHCKWVGGHLSSRIFFLFIECIH